MILTPIRRDKLAETLSRFEERLCDPSSRGVFRQIRNTSPDRAAPAEAEHDRLVALCFARTVGMAVHPAEVFCPFNWDGMALNGATEAYVILHEIAHFALAPAERRNLIEFGLGPGPDTIDRETAEQAAAVSPPLREEDEAATSLLGIIWEAELGQPALASFLDQNWLEGLDRSAASHFSSVLGRLEGLNLLTLAAAGESRKA